MLRQAYPFAHIHSNLTKRPSRLFSMIPEFFSQENTHTVALQSGQKMRIKSCINGRSHDRNSVLPRDKTYSVLDEHFSKIPADQIQFTWAPLTEEILHTKDLFVIQDKMRTVCDDIRIDGVKLVLPHEGRTEGLNLTTKDGVHFESLFQLAYQEPAHGSIDAHRSEIEKTLLAGMDNWKALVQASDYVKIQHLRSETPYVSAPSPCISKVFMVQRGFIKTSEADIRTQFIRDLEQKIQDNQRFGWPTLCLGGLSCLWVRSYDMANELANIKASIIEGKIPVGRGAIELYDNAVSFFPLLCLVVMVAWIIVIFLLIHIVAILNDMGKLPRPAITGSIIAALGGIPLGLAVYCFGKMIEH